MSDDEKKLIIDDDWKVQARQEKERLEREVEEKQQAGKFAEPDFPELLNLIVMQAMVGLGMVGGPGGKPYPPDLGLAKHFIDLLQVLEDKTKNNLTPDEQKMMDQTLYQLRMIYVQVSGGGAGPAAGPEITPGG